MARLLSTEVRRLCEEIQECRDSARLLELGQFLSLALERQRELNQFDSEARSGEYVDCAK